MKHSLPVILFVSSVAAITGCASNLSGDTYSRADARATQQVEYGVVEDIRLVVIEGSNSKIGAASGAILGGIGANTVGGGRGKAAATVVGAVAGGVVGSKVEEATTRSQGEEITVRMDNGRTIAVVQQVSPKTEIRIGDRVRLLTVNGATRVTR